MVADNIPMRDRPQFPYPDFFEESENSDSESSAHEEPTTTTETETETETETDETSESILPSDLEDYRYLYDAGWPVYMIQAIDYDNKMAGINAYGSPLNSDNAMDAESAASEDSASTPASDNTTTSEETTRFAAVLEEQLDSELDLAAQSASSESEPDQLPDLPESDDSETGYDADNEEDPDILSKIKCRSCPDTTVPHHGHLSDDSD